MKKNFLVVCVILLLQLIDGQPYNDYDSFEFENEYLPNKLTTNNAVSETLEQSEQSSTDEPNHTADTEDTSISPGELPLSTTPNPDIARWNLISEQCHDFINNVLYKNLEEIISNYDNLIEPYNNVGCKSNIRRTVLEKINGFESIVDNDLKVDITNRLEILRRMQIMLMDIKREMITIQMKQTVDIDSQTEVLISRVVSYLNNFDFDRAAKHCNRGIDTNALKKIISVIFAGSYKNYEKVLRLLERIDMVDLRFNGYYYLFKELQDIGDVDNAASMAIAYNAIGAETNIDISDKTFLNLEYILTNLPNHIKSFPFGKPVRIWNPVYEGYLHSQTAYDSKRTCVVNKRGSTQFWNISSYDGGLTFNIDNFSGRFIVNESYKQLEGWKAHMAFTTKDFMLGQKYGDWKLEPINSDGQFNIRNVFFDELLLTSYATVGQDHVVITRNETSKNYKWEFLTQ